MKETHSLTYSPFEREEMFSAEARDPASRDVSPNDSPRAVRRRLRDMHTVSLMIALYCKHHHPRESRTVQAYCGQYICESCAKIDAYAVLRTQRCKKMEVKTSCDRCEHHCYRKEEQHIIRTIMRFSGPRMLLYHPLAAIRHMLGK